jgi:hypothetical protein
MAPKAENAFGRAIDIPAGTAVWVLFAHLFVLLSAVPTMLVFETHREVLAKLVHSPAMIYAGVVVYTVGIAFEIAQNASDRWYLTQINETFCDGLFYSFMVAGFALIAMGVSHEPWLWAVLIATSLLHPVAYVAGHFLRFILLTTALLLVDYAMYDALRDPVVFLHTIFTFAGLYFLALLMRTHAQSLHGAAAACFGLSFLAFPLALTAHVQGTPSSFSSVGWAVLGLVGLLGAAFPLLSRARASRRRLPPGSHSLNAEQLA